MGAPMVCMYLLGNLDHYTNHTFVPFYWHTFILEAQKPWDVIDPSTHADKVALFKTRKEIVGLSPVHDYIYRPSEFKDVSLYQWVLQYECRKYKSKDKKKKRKKGKGEPLDAGKHSDLCLHNNKNEIDMNDDDSNSTVNDESHSSGTEEPAHSDVSDVETLVDNTIPMNLPKNMYKFQKKHPFYETHVAILKPLKPTTVVNFIGCTLPRCDQGDREYYCLTMLALFKPWRTGLDLKQEKNLGMKHLMIMNSQKEKSC